ncbi:MAG: outer membrane protein assembly factor BamA [Pseudomonadota bacterium]
MKAILNFARTAIAALALYSASGLVAGQNLPGLSSIAQAAVVRSITVQGNQRVDADTVRSYVTIVPGRSFSNFDIDESVKQLFATGLFGDVEIFQRRRILVVVVTENPTVNQVIFKGNKRLKDGKLKEAIQLDGRSILSEGALESDVNRIREAYRLTGRTNANVSGRTVELPNNRVNVVFDINEGGKTKIKKITFIGNSAYRDGRLKEVITIKQSNLLSWLKNDDIYDEDRLRADEERLRRFYFNHGYADFRVISSIAELDAENNHYIITITVDEGDLYRFGDVSVDNAIQEVDTDRLERLVKTRTGDKYSADKVEKTLVALTNEIAGSGYAFAQVTPRGSRDFDSQTISVIYLVDEGPRVYIERIDIRGNTRTRDHVIRREFDVSEGDAYNRVLVNRAKRRLDALGYFKTVSIGTEQGSSPDRVVLVVRVEDQPTGEFSIGGGYSTASGALAEISFSEKNFLGRGQHIRIAAGLGLDDDSKYEFSFTEPYFLGRRIAAGFDIVQSTTTADDSILYENVTTLGRLRAKFPLNDDLSVELNYTFKNEDISVSNPAAVSAATRQAIGTWVTSSVGYTVVYSTIDNFQVPREGIYVKFSQDFAGVGGDASYIKTTGRATAYHTVSEEFDLVVMGAVGAGHIVGLGQNLRIVDNFFQGGETIRGFARYGIGPRDIGTNEALGGTTYINATAELQFPLPAVPTSFGLRGAVFAEAGTLYGNEFSGAGLAASTLSTFNDDTIRASIGASIIWNSPFGPLRADFAHALNKAAFDRTELFRFGVSTKF